MKGGQLPTLIKEGLQTPYNDRSENNEFFQIVPVGRDPDQKSNEI
jgi:hypothetical protein